MRIKLLIILATIFIFNPSNVTADNNSINFGIGVTQDPYGSSITNFFFGFSENDYNNYDRDYNNRGYYNHGGRRYYKSPRYHYGPPRYPTHYYRPNHYNRGKGGSRYYGRGNNPNYNRDNSNRGKPNRHNDNRGNNSNRGNNNRGGNQGGGNRGR